MSVQWLRHSLDVIRLRFMVINFTASCLFISWHGMFYTFCFVTSNCLYCQLIKPFWIIFLGSLSVQNLESIYKYTSALRCFLMLCSHKRNSFEVHWDKQVQHPLNISRSCGSPHVVGNQIAVLLTVGLSVCIFAPPSPTISKDKQQLLIYHLSTGTLKTASTNPSCRVFCQLLLPCIPVLWVQMEVKVRHRLPSATQDVAVWIDWGVLIDQLIDLNHNWSFKRKTGRICLYDLWIRKLLCLNRIIQVQVVYIIQGVLSFFLFVHLTCRRVSQHWQDLRRSVETFCTDFCPMCLCPPKRY